MDLVVFFIWVDVGPILIEEPAIVVLVDLVLVEIGLIDGVILKVELFKEGLVEVMVDFVVNLDTVEVFLDDLVLVIVFVGKLVFLLVELLVE